MRARPVCGHLRVYREQYANPGGITSGLPVIREGRWWHISSSLLESHSPMAGLRSAKSPHTYLLLPLRNIHALHKKPKAE